MSSITDHDPQAWRQAVRRFRRFNLWAAIAVVALFTVLAVKAQVLPRPTWFPLPPFAEAYENHQVFGHVKSTGVSPEVSRPVLASP